MNKETFLGELREYLKILEDQEQDDILAEYAQHIDMKMQKGLSEEEAIKDFGSMQELAAGILEAYHVKPEFRQRDEKKLIRKQKKENIDKKVCKSLNFVKSGAAKIKRKFAGVFHAIGRGFRRMGEKCLHFGRRITAPFRKGDEQRVEKATDGQAEIAEKQADMQGRKKMGGRIGHFIKATGRGIAALWRIFADFCIWWIRLFWNLGWVLFAFICAFFCMIALMGVGAMSVLLFQGYPLAGLFLICSGGILMFGALTGGAFSLLIRKEKIAPAAAGCEKTGYESAGRKEAERESTEDKAAGYFGEEADRA